MKQYNSYHTIIKQLVKRNSLPGSYLKEINRSPLWRWKHEPNDKYFGSELNNIEVFEQFINRSETQVVMRSYLRIACAFSSILVKSGQLYLLINQDMPLFVNTVLRYQYDIRPKIVLRLLKIPVSYLHGKGNINVNVYRV
jgi:hypothetical protein